MTSTTSLEDQRRHFFETARLDERVYSERWLSFRLGPLTIHYPMTAGMRVALPRHDLHHVLTGYGVDAIGEAEIAAWEIASGCGTNLTAWFGNLAFMSVGVVLRPRRVLAAFLRGRVTSNLYRSTESLEDLLARPLLELREASNLTRQQPPARLRDHALAWLAAMLSVPVGLLFLVALAPLSLVRYCELRGAR